jgi:transposase-like protein
MNTKQGMQKFTIKDFDLKYPDDDTCLEWLRTHRWPDGIECPTCKKITKHHKITGRQAYACDNCGHQVSPTAGTIFHKSATPLRIWFEVIHRMASTRCGISAKQIERETGVTYKTAWRMFKQIRTLLGEVNPMFTGKVEVDETYIGGKRPGKRGRGASGKTAVIGIAQRQGKVSTNVVTDTKRSTVMPLIQKNVAQKTTIFTDEYPTYDALSNQGFEHKRCNHGSGEYVVGDVHTNTIEGFWSLVKRGISGVYHAVSPKYLQSYLNEYEFRYNHRNEETPMFDLFLDRI